MKRLQHSPQGFIRIFTSLCLNQVKEQLTENMTTFSVNRESFILDGDLYVFAHNKSLIIDESLKEYGVEMGECHCLN
jgi:hypothetical protein